MGPFGDAIVALMATLAQQERESIRQRTLAGLERARREGKKLGRPCRVFDRSKVHTLRKQSLSYRAIAKRLGVPTMLVHNIANGKL